MADRTSTYGRSSEEIRREIERTRAEMDETVDRLGERLSPGRMMDELWSRFRKGDGLSNVSDALREHPIPLALMGLGLGWLAIERATEHDGHDGRSRFGRSVGPGTWAPAEGRRGPYGPEAVRHDDPDWVHTPKVTKVKAKLSHAGERISEVVHEKSETLKERVHELKERSAEKSHVAHAETSGRMEHLKERVGETREHLAEEVKVRAH